MDSQGAIEPDACRREIPGQAGFTLVELLVVLAILGLLIAAVAPPVIRYLGRAKVDTAHLEVTNIATALDLFMIDVGRYPTQQEGLAALVVNPGIAKWEGPYLKAGRMPLDPWDHPYQYRIPGTQRREYDLFSFGPDGKGTASSIP